MAEPTLHEFTASDGYASRFRRFLPTKAARASIVGLHGIQSHGGWYEESCRQLCESGHAVSFLDRRGSGLNHRERGDAPSFRRLLDDIAEFIAPLPRPRYLMGISWGGKLALAFTRRHADQVHGLILLAPGLCPRVQLPIRERLRIAAARVISPRRRFAIPLNDAELFTANPERQRFIRDDPLALREATARLLFESARLDIYLRSARRTVSVSTLLLLAREDRIIDNQATRQFVTQFQSSDQTAIEFAGAHHTLEFEPGGPPFIKDVLSWLDSRRGA